VERFPLNIFHAANSPGGLMVTQLVKKFPAFCNKFVGFRRRVIEGSDLEI